MYFWALEAYIMLTTLYKHNLSNRIVFLLFSEKEIHEDCLYGQRTLKKTHSENERMGEWQGFCSRPFSFKRNHHRFIPYL